jgi:four helix bundle protein
MRQWINDTIRDPKRADEAVCNTYYQTVSNIAENRGSTGNRSAGPPSGTSVAANYRAACRARSKVEFIAKMGIVVEEADETVFWLELLVDAQIIQ